MNQEQIISQIINALPKSEKTKFLYQFVCDKPENLQTVLDIFTRSSKTEDEIQTTIFSSKPAMSLSEIQSDSEREDDEVDLMNMNEDPIFPPGTVTLRRFTDLELQRLNQLSKAQRRETINALNLSRDDRQFLNNKLWRLRNPDRVRRNSRKSYQKRRLSNDRQVTFDVSLPV